jgi:hypothetical protein
MPKADHDTTTTRRAMLAAAPCWPAARPHWSPALPPPPWPVRRRCRLLAVSSLPCSDVNHRDHMT